MGSRVGEVGVVGLELFELVTELLDPRSGGGVVHGAVLESRVIPIDLALGGGHLRNDRVEFGVPVGVAVAEFFLGGGDGFGEQGFGVCAEVVQRLEDSFSAASAAMRPPWSRGAVPVAVVAVSGAAFGGVPMYCCRVGRCQPARWTSKPHWSTPSYRPVPFPTSDHHV